MSLINRRLYCELTETEIPASSITFIHFGAGVVESFHLKIIESINDSDSEEQCSESIHAIFESVHERRDEENGFSSFSYHYFILK